MHTDQLLGHRWILIIPTALGLILLSAIFDRIYTTVCAVKASIALHCTLTLSKHVQNRRDVHNTSFPSHAEHYGYA